MRRCGRVLVDYAVEFQSTHSLRSATVEYFNEFGEDVVSIHALLAECDTYEAGVMGIVNSFNPRTPCGVRPDFTDWEGIILRFQSTHSLRSATSGMRVFDMMTRVSIHALLAECDCLHALRVTSGKSFNPRTPCGVRRGRSWTFDSGTGFNPRTPCGVRRPHCGSTVLVLAVSIHALLAECDQGPMMDPKGVTSFNPRTPCGVRP